jgi:hypothetical protein
MQVRVVTRQLPTESQPTVHKAYYFCPDMISTRQPVDMESHIAAEIEKDLTKFKEEFVEFKRAVFKILPATDVPTVYLY